MRMRKFLMGVFALGLGLMTMVIYASQVSEDNNLLASADLTTYHIVYLVDESLPVESLLAMNGALAQAINAVSVASWQRVMELDDQRSIDALVIHQSAYQQIDRSWTAAASRRGVVLAVVNMHLPEMAEIVNSGCMRQELTQHINPFAELDGYYYMDAGLVLTDDPSEQHLVEEAVHHGCRQNPAIQSQVYGIGLATHRPLTNDAEIASFGHVLRLYIESIHDHRQSFQNRHLPPTPVPN